jgi:hypothetical protein
MKSHIVRSNPIHIPPRPKKYNFAYKKPVFGHRSSVPDLDDHANDIFAIFEAAADRTVPSEEVQAYELYLVNDCNVVFLKNAESGQIEEFRSAFPNWNNSMKELLAILGQIMHFDGYVQALNALQEFLGLRIDQIRHDGVSCLMCIHLSRGQIRKFTHISQAEEQNTIKKEMIFSQYTKCRYIHFD